MLSTDRDLLVNYESPTHGVKDRTNSYKRRDGQEMSQGKYCRLLTDLILLSFQYLFWLNFPVFIFLSVFFWQSSKKVRQESFRNIWVVGSRSRSINVAQFALTSVHNNQDKLFCIYPPIFIDSLHDNSEPEKYNDFDRTIIIKEDINKINV